MVAFGGLLLGVLLVIVAVIVWQESKRRPSYEPLEYVIEDAVKHIHTGLVAEGKEGLTRVDVRRIIEWEVFYLQGLAQDDRRNPVETVAGGHEASLDFILDRVENVSSLTYSREEVADVLRLEADYLVRIGAVGEPVGPIGGEEE